MKSAIFMLSLPTLLIGLFLCRVYELSSIKQNGIEGVFYPSKVLSGWTKAGSATYRVQGLIDENKVTLQFKEKYPTEPVRIVYDKGLLDAWLTNPRGSFYDFYQGTKESSPIQLEVAELGFHFWLGVGLTSLFALLGCQAIADEWYQKAREKRKSRSPVAPTFPIPTRTIQLPALGVKRIHEPARAQMADLRKMYPPHVAEMMLSGPSCDEVPGATGLFGKCLTNPIPVNGLAGVFKYLGKLRVDNEGWGIYFHRICSADSPISNHRTDIYETVSIDGKKWDVLFFDLFHPRRSNRCPEGYFLTPYLEAVDRLHFCYGCDEQLISFPSDLPIALERNSFPEAFIRNCKERLQTTKFERPKEHLTRLREIKVTGVFTPRVIGSKH
jgi:hypothetical protein